MQSSILATLLHKLMECIIMLQPYLVSLAHLCRLSTFLAGLCPTVCSAALSGSGASSTKFDMTQIHIIACELSTERALLSTFVASHSCAWAAVWLSKTRCLRTRTPTHSPCKMFPTSAKLHFACHNVSCARARQNSLCWQMARRNCCRSMPAVTIRITVF